MRPTLIHLSLLLVLTLFFNSCIDSTIDPIEDEGSVFSIYGQIEIGKTPNYIRIRDLSIPLLAERTEFDGEVTFEDLQTNQIYNLEDTVVNFNGNYTHNFRIDAEIEPENQYLIKAVRSDGAVVQSIATSPKITETEYVPASSVFCETDMTLIFRNVEQPESIDFDISVTHNGQEYSSRLNLFADQLRYVGDDEVHIQLSPRNLLVEIFTPVIPDNPYFNMYLLRPTISCENVSSSEIRIDYTHFGVEWAIGKPFRNGGIDFDSEDVENGLGFFGALGRGSFIIEYQK